MSRLLFFDCFSGASGDMVLGALLDAGLPIDELRRALGSLAIEGYEIGADRVLRAGVSATKFRLYERGAAGAGHRTGEREGGHGHERDHRHGPRRGPEQVHAGEHAQAHDPASHGHSQVHEQGQAHEHRHGGVHAHDHAHRHDDGGRHEDAPGGQAAREGPDHGHRSLAEIGRLIERSALSPAGRARAIELFRRLAEEEAAVHEIPIDRVHLHEVGALDSIIDIVGAVHGLEWLGADRIVSSPLNVGGGTVVCAHGRFPVPAPATARLLRGVPVYSGGEQVELVTPTGALLVSGYAQAYGPLPPMRIGRLAYGAGERDLRDRPNVLRLVIGEAEASRHGDRVVAIECEIDDMNPQIYGRLMDQLYAAGALEVFYSPVQMKKNRPGVLLTVIAPPDRRTAIADLVFSETTTIGMRYQEVERECLERELVPVETPLGAVRFKIARRGGRVLNASPEFDDCARLAAERGLPVKEVQALAVKAWLDRTR
jgi:pyridinium-3,5-bisthiocarboxylic acid mononucleotide nickel chelatase